jgi:hypothetical protein
MAKHNSSGEKNTWNAWIFLRRLLDSIQDARRDDGYRARIYWTGIKDRSIYGLSIQFADDVVCLSGGSAIYDVLLAME